MVKTWPVLTKSVTSGLIYVAADLSSQVVNGNTVGTLFFFFFSCLFWEVYYLFGFQENGRKLKENTFRSVCWRDWKIC